MRLTVRLFGRCFDNVDVILVVSLVLIALGAWLVFQE